MRASIWSRLMKGSFGMVLAVFMAEAAGARPSWYSSSDWLAIHPWYSSPGWLAFQTGMK